MDRQNPKCHIQTKFGMNNAKSVCTPISVPANEVECTLHRGYGQSSVYT